LQRHARHDRVVRAIWRVERGQIARCEADRHVSRIGISACALDHLVGKIDPVDYASPFRERDCEMSGTTARIE
jgi:hypothetical protein